MSTPPDQSEPIFDVAEFSSFELFSPDVDSTLWFFKDLLGMIETERSGDSVFLRGWHDPYNHSLKVTQRDHAGMGFAGWRTTSKPALDRRVKALQETGRGRGWVDGECGMGDAFEFTLPDGSVQRIHWDVDYYRAPEDEQSVLKNRPQRRPLAGVPVESLDHLNLLAKNVTDNKEFCAEALGFRLTEHIVFGDDTEGGAWMRLNTRSHDVAFTRDASGRGGRLHHVAFHYGNAQHLEDACDVLTDHGLELEAGPARHGISRAQFVYVLEPGGNRIELVGIPAYTIKDPSFEPVRWAQDTMDSAIIWYGSPLPKEFDTYGTPNYDPTEYRTANRHPRGHADDYIAAEASLLL
jgi:catechol 2,3-dioxygenase